MSGVRTCSRKLSIHCKLNGLTRRDLERFKYASCLKTGDNILDTMGIMTSESDVEFWSSRLWNVLTEDMDGLRDGKK